jgi:quercetin dioxygenase-like cupin family protein
MRKGVATAITLATTYVLVSSILHYMVFPEPFAAGSDLPRTGATLVNEGIRSRFVYRHTSVETAGRLFEWDNFVEPGGGPREIPHLHPHMREVFQIVDGEVAFVINGQEHVARRGSTVVVQPGAVHAFRNVADHPAHMISRFETVHEGSWTQLAERGLLVDSTFVQINRAGGLGRVSPIQMLVFVSRYKQSYPPGLPTWAWDAIAFVIAPTARIFGVHAYYPPPAPSR